MFNPKGVWPHVIFLKLKVSNWLLLSIQTMVTWRGRQGDGQAPRLQWRLHQAGWSWKWKFFLSYREIQPQAHWCRQGKISLIELLEKFTLKQLQDLQQRLDLPPNKQNDYQWQCWQEWLPFNQTKLVNSNLDWNPIGISGTPTRKHLQIVVAAVLRVAVRCRQHSDACLSCQFN